MKLDVKEMVTATEYFNTLKDKKRNITNKELDKVYRNCLKLMDKYVATEQHSGAKKLLFHLEMIEKEQAAIEAGIHTYVYRDDVEYYIDNIAQDTVKIIELKRFEREIPDDVVTEYMKVKDIFDEFYVIFTDYTGKEQTKAMKEREQYEIEKDPILFGVLKSEEAATMVGRFYWIGDWEDNYCDLTLEKMVSEYDKYAPEGKKSNVVHELKVPKDLDELRNRFKELDKRVNEDESRRFISSSARGLRVENDEINQEKGAEKNKGLVKKVLSFLGRK